MDEQRAEVRPPVEVHVSPMAMMISERAQAWVDQIRTRSWHLAQDRHHVRR